MLSQEENISFWLFVLHRKRWVLCFDCFIINICWTNQKIDLFWRLSPYKPIKTQKIRVFIGSDISWCEHRLRFQKEIAIQSARFYKIINKKPCTLPIYKQRQNTLLSLFIYCSVSIKQLFANRFMQKLWDLQSAWHQGEKWFLWKVFIFGCLKNFNLVILAVEYFCEIVYNICE